MYVAITRARKRLYLSFSQTRMLHGQTRYNVKSRFFDELPEGALKWITPQQPGLRLGLRARLPARALGSAARGCGSIVGTGRVEPRCRRADRAEGAVARPARRARRCSTPSSARAWS